ncbi:hypothetical protein ACFZBU_35700 [Embleya sp. NPDC008237]|uniref:hypothetical protein n=1 Tax=Embleya sp. NPDC008237 TaxID=3363978 RepID=UPI0036EC57A8
MFTKKAVVMSVLYRIGEREEFAELSRFRTDFFECRLRAVVGRPAGPGRRMRHLLLLAVVVIVEVGSVRVTQRPQPLNPGCGCGVR